MQCHSVKWNDLNSPSQEPKPNNQIHVAHVLKLQPRTVSPEGQCLSKMNWIYRLAVQSSLW